MKNVTEGTTEIIRRRIKHWKTTAVGIGIIVLPLVSSIWPEHSDAINRVLNTLVGGGFILTADAAKEKFLGKSS